MSRNIDQTEVPERRQHVYFYVILVLATVLAATIKNHYFPAPKSEHKELADGVKRLLETGAVVKDLY